MQSPHVAHEPDDQAHLAAQPSACVGHQLSQRGPDATLTESHSVHLEHEPEPQKHLASHAVAWLWHQISQPSKTSQKSHVAHSVEA